jgi:hypothetical protein
LRTVPRGTYRVSDSERVDFADALEIWVPLARERLIEVAGRYHAVVTHAELAARVQGLSGIRTRWAVPKWIKWLLEGVATQGKSDEPPLTSLCVHHDGTMGKLYPQVGAPPRGTDIEMYAAEHRLLCYQRYASDLPPGGGVAVLTPQVIARRTPKSTKREEPEPDRCPVHHTSLPASGQCDYCEML